MYKSKLKLRAQIISYIYSQLVLNKKLNDTEAFESVDYSPQAMKAITAICNNFNYYQTVVEQFLQHNWTWARIAYLEQAILIYGAYELQHEDKALVINELIDITKGYIPGDKYKFINAILEKVGVSYETTT